MASQQTIVWIERLVWILIYGGLLTFVLGLASVEAALVAGWSLVVVGGCVAAVGVLLIWVRSRLNRP